LHLSVVRAPAVARQTAAEVDEAVRWFLAVLRVDPYDERHTSPDRADGPSHRRPEQPQH
jgi:hypothetical protein